MKKLGAMVLILCLGLALTSGEGTLDGFQRDMYILSEGENNGPTIEWGGPNNSSETMAIAWDGAYTGQTEETWHLDAWINDTDFVDTVIFRFSLIGKNEWSDLVPTLIEGNNNLGRYQYNYTYAVWWNYTLNRPQVEVPGGNFDLKIFANDTLGHWTETGILTYMGGYMLVQPPPEIVFFSNLIPSLAAVGIIVVVISVVIIFRRRT